MSKSKAHEFTHSEVALADAAKALSHPARLKILKILSHIDVCMCGEIVDLLPLAQATVSQHLKELKRVGFIKGEIEGPKTCYCINSKVVQHTFSELTNFYNDINREGKRSCKTQTK